MQIVSTTSKKLLNKEEENKSPVHCHLPRLVFKDMLVKTVFRLKPLESRRKKTLGDADAGGK